MVFLGGEDVEDDHFNYMQWVMQVIRVGIEQWGHESQSVVGWYHYANIVIVGSG